MESGNELAVVARTGRVQERCHGGSLKQSQKSDDILQIEFGLPESGGVLGRSLVAAAAGSDLTSAV